MGLDNGIVVRMGDKNKKGLYDFWEELDLENEIEVAYWRKCWGIRDQILNLLDVDLEGEKDYKLDIEQLKNIIDLLKKFTHRNYWEKYADSIWEFHEYRSHQLKIIKNLKKVCKLMEKEPDLDVYFYDSY